MGQQLSLAGDTVKPFSVWLQLVKHFRPTLVVHECTRTFDPEILSFFLKQYKVRLQFYAMFKEPVVTL